jgi:hypothetical protein
MTPEFQGFIEANILETTRNKLHSRSFFSPIHEYNFSRRPQPRSRPLLLSSLSLEIDVLAPGLASLALGAPLHRPVLPSYKHRL